MMVPLEEARQAFLKVSDAYDVAIKQIESAMKKLRKGTKALANYEAGLKKLKRAKQRFVKSVGL